MSNSIEAKKSNPQYPVHELIQKRWSALSFSDKKILKDDLNTILEAASWAPSSNNEQEWLYFTAHHGTEGFHKIWGTLMGGNQPWTKNAAVLLISVARTTFAANGNPNDSALHDVGLANANLLLQATALGIYGHMMGGYEKEKVKTLLNLPDTQQPVAVIALGYLDDADKLEEPFKTRELTPRSRKSLSEIVTEL